MSNEVGEPGAGPAEPVAGAVRFTADGHLEIYGADGWQPLLRMIDVDAPAVTREIGQIDGSDDTGADGAGPGTGADDTDSDGGPDRDRPAPG